jgi:tRNA threonylcarbamoyladenosine biosynthesis protein TsaE
MRVISHSVSETIKIGRLIAKRLKPGDIICLFGELGSGKTVLTKGIAQGLGIDKAKVISPSFILIREHLQGRLPLYHFDLYRLKNTQDILSIGYQEYIYGEGIVVIEWSDRLNYLMPPAFLRVELFLNTDTERSLRLSAFGWRYKELLRGIHEDIRH